ncbi:MAG TPA: sigma-54 dependent transcriptional regulator [Myxococcales bacterium]|jgi:sigma-54 specific flagellar transcriptional regulator A|nr:sigma-54 dependent transcriptional regulator [Myxococcales bacterium]
MTSQAQRSNAYSEAYTQRSSKPSGRPLIYAFDSPMQEVEQLLVRIAKSDATCLITGETGSGKEIAARELHAHSARADKPFVAVNCAAIPEALLESELFGHVRGAFTGANTARQGRVALAEGGTLFLDEIGELPLSMQSKLLRMIQERVYEPVGSTRPLNADFRLVAATNRDLEAEVAAGRFRQDLYFRLFVCPIHLPSLRERASDIQILFAHFWRLKGETRQVSPETLELLQAYAWPGNVREMENLAERLSVCASGERLEVTDLPVNVRGIEVAFEVVAEELSPDQSHEDLQQLPVKPRELRAVPEPVMTAAPVEAAPVEAAPSAAAPAVAAPAIPATPMLPIDLPTMLRELEENYIAQALAESKGNKALAAKMLGMQRTTLAEKLRRRSKRDHSSEESFATV